MKVIKYIIMLIMSSCENEHEDKEETPEIWDTEEVCETCRANHNHYGTGYQAMLD